MLPSRPVSRVKLEDNFAGGHAFPKGLEKWRVKNNVQQR
jgi:hypothetical protein